MYSIDKYVGFFARANVATMSIANDCASCIGSIDTDKVAPEVINMDADASSESTIADDSTTMTALTNGTENRDTVRPSNKAKSNAIDDSDTRIEQL